MTPRRNTKIVATIGPASIAPRTLKAVAAAGMDCARINTAHGDFGQYLTIVRRVRALGPIPVMLDIKGPEVRTRCARPLPVAAGQVVAFGGPDVQLSARVARDVRPRDRLLLENGLYEFRVARARGGVLYAKAKTACVIRNHKGVNFPNVALSLPALSAKDRAAVRFANAHRLEYIALSFARSARDVKALRRLLRPGLHIIAKIENQEGLDHADEILEAADGLMVARGDLGVEIPPERVPLAQKLLIRRANLAGKVVVTATEMLQSMMTATRPTRAETTDVANAVWDGTDAVMLSGESAEGQHPAESVAAMARICAQAEPSVNHKLSDHLRNTVADGVSAAIYDFAERLPVTKIVAITSSGRTARMISRFRLKDPVLAVTDSDLAALQLRLVYGVEAHHYGTMPPVEKILQAARFCVRRGLIRPADTVIFTAGLHSPAGHPANTFQVHNIRDLLRSHGRLKRELQE